MYSGIPQLRETRQRMFDVFEIMKILRRLSIDKVQSKSQSIFEMECLPLFVCDADKRHGISV